jgi:hypothetical protein
LRQPVRECDAMGWKLFAVRENFSSFFLLLSHTHIFAWPHNFSPPTHPIHYLIIGINNKQKTKNPPRGIFRPINKWWCVFYFIKNRDQEKDERSQWFKFSEEHFFGQFRSTNKSEKKGFSFLFSFLLCRLDSIDLYTHKREIETRERERETIFYLFIADRKCCIYVRRYDVIPDGPKRPPVSVSSRFFVFKCRPTYK